MAITSAAAERSAGITAESRQQMMSRRDTDFQWIGDWATYLVLGALLTYLGGCSAPQPHMMATPVVFKDERLDFGPHVLPELRTTRLPVFYATTRAPVRRGDVLSYSNRPGEELRLGIADVRLGAPDWTFDDLLASDWTGSVAKPRPGAVEHLEELGTVPGKAPASEMERRMVERIDEQLAKVRNRTVVLYVHGYRVTFDEVTVMMASFSAYLGHGAMMTFQWPTGQHFWNYLTDCPRAERYIPDIERMIVLLSQTRAQTINLIAYSCGSPLLARACSVAQPPSR